jgi:hypothetical protein
MGIRVKPERIAWVEEFGTLDSPIATFGSTVITMRAAIWIGIGALLIIKALGYGLITPIGILLSSIGAFAILIAIIPSKSVRRDLQLLFAIKLTILRLTQGNPNKKKTKSDTKVKKHKEKINKKKKEEKGVPKKKVKPAPLSKK